LADAGALDGLADGDREGAADDGARDGDHEGADTEGARDGREVDGAAEGCEDDGALLGVREGALVGERDGLRVMHDAARMLSYIAVRFHAVHDATGSAVSACVTDAHLHCGGYVTPGSCELWSLNKAQKLHVGQGVTWLSATALTLVLHAVDCSGTPFQNEAAAELQTPVALGMTSTLTTVPCATSSFTTAVSLVTYFWYATPTGGPTSLHARARAGVSAWAPRQLRTSTSTRARRTG